jgi:hypothetical protein
VKKKLEDFLISEKLDYASHLKMENAPKHQLIASMPMDRRKSGN